MSSIQIAIGVVNLIAVAISSIRWFRVAQREHYLFPYTSRYAWRWWTSAPYNILSALSAVVGTLASSWFPGASLVAAAVVILAPFGLPLRGRTSPLRWTRRMVTTAALTFLFAGLWTWAAVVAQTLDASAAFLCLAMPACIDLSLLLSAPFERMLAHRYVTRAKVRLDGLSCERIAITGSYGKTSTKNYVATLLSVAGTASPSPASFNNQAGLARAVNESLPSDSRFFIAEMDAYGSGEIRRLCKWIRPSISVLTAVGPVHLERFHSQEAIVRALAEVFETADVAVVQTDDDRMLELSNQLERDGKKVIRCGETTGSVRVFESEANLVVEHEGKELATMANDGTHAPSNLACAVGVALAAGLTPGQIQTGLSNIQPIPHRHQVFEGNSGATIIDNTFNSNPASAKASLELLEKLAQPGGKRVVVTPGMIELGYQQFGENEKFSQMIAQRATHAIYVGLTNLHPLRHGSTGANIEIKWYPTREEAVAWVRKNVAKGDVVLYENDLPDHIP